jgi:DNA end-binding protein Ku
MVDEKAIILQLLRFPEEFIPQSKFDFPELKLDIKKQEMTVAQALIKSMSTKWNPKKYHDDYEKDLLSFIHEKIKLGKSPQKSTKSTSHKTAEVIDMMSLLKKSIKTQKK